MVAAALVAWFGVGAPVAVVLVVIAALAAASAGAPFGAAVALAGGIADFLARSGQHQPAAADATLVFLAGIAVSALFYGNEFALEDPSDVQGGQSAFRGGSQRALRGESGTSHTSIAALASGIREVSQGDFTKNIAVSDAALQELAIALNKLIFGMREFLGQLHAQYRNARRSRHRFTLDRLDRACRYRRRRALRRGSSTKASRNSRRIVEEATGKVLALSEAISTIAASAEQQTRSLDETALAVSNMASFDRRSGGPSRLAREYLDGNVANRRTRRNVDRYDRRRHVQRFARRSTIWRATSGSSASTPSKSATSSK